MPNVKYSICRCLLACVNDEIMTSIYVNVPASFPFSECPLWNFFLRDCCLDGGEAIVLCICVLRCLLTVRVLLMGFFVDVRGLSLCGGRFSWIQPVCAHFPTLCIFFLHATAMEDCRFCEIWGVGSFWAPGKSCSPCRNSLEIVAEWQFVVVRDSGRVTIYFC
jgi:hypothetical protein